MCYTESTYRNSDISNNSGLIKSTLFLLAYLSMLRVIFWDTLMNVVRVEVRDARDVRDVRPSTVCLAQI